MAKLIPNLEKMDAQDLEFLYEDHSHSRTLNHLIALCVRMKDWELQREFLGHLAEALMVDHFVEEAFYEATRRCGEAEKASEGNHPSPKEV